MEATKAIHISAEEYSVIKGILIPLWREQVDSLEEADKAPSIIYGQELGIDTKAPLCMMFNSFCWGFERGLNAAVEHISAKLTTEALQELREAIKGD